MNPRRSDVQLFSLYNYLGIGLQVAYDYKHLKSVWYYWIRFQVQKGGANTIKTVSYLWISNGDKKGPKTHTLQYLDKVKT